MNKAKKILVAGGSGFVGSHVVAQLSKAGYHVIVPTRNRRKASHLFLLPNVQVVTANIVENSTAILPLLQGCSAVINLLGILHGQGSYLQGKTYNRDFSRIFVEFPNHLVQSIAEQREKTVTQLIHMSAIGTHAQAPSQYLRARAEGEAIVRQAHGLATTIIRPSLIVSPEAPFVQMTKKLVQYLPILFMPRLDFQIQPVGAEDVARVIVQSLHNPEAESQTYELAGQKVFTMSEWMHTCAAALGKSRVLLEQPMPVARTLAWLFERLPNPPISRDNLDSMKVPNVSSKAFPFGIQPQSINSIFKTFSLLEQLKELRTSARRT